MRSRQSLPSYDDVIGAPKGYAGYMVAIGDSIIGNAISNGGTAPAYQTYLHQRGYLNVFQSIYNYPFEMPVRYQGATLAYGANAGIGSEFTRQGLARLQADVLVQNPTDVWWNFGTNDIKNDYTAANVFANTIAAYHAAMKSGVKRFWVPGVLPRNNDGAVDFSAGQETIRLAYNDLLAEFELANSGSFIYIDPDPTMLDPATGKLYSSYSYDGLHPNSKGAYAFAGAIGAKYEAMGGRVIPKAITPDYNASTNPYGNLFANGAFTGTTGSPSSGASGTLPTSWDSSRTAGTTSTAVWSIVSEANLSGTTVNKAQAVLTSDGLAADTEIIQLKPATTDATTGVAAGGWYEAEFEVDVAALSGNEIIRAIYISFIDQATGGERVRMFSSRYTSGGSVKDKFFTNGAETFVIKTPPLYAKGTTGLRVNLNFDIDGTVSGTRTIKVSSPILRAVPPPFIRYEDSSRIQRLFVLRTADMQSTSDRIFEKTFRGTNYIITNVVAVRKSGGTSVACAGGIYTAASKGGTALVDNTQDWVSLTGAGKAVKATLAAAADTDTQSAVPYFSLTTGSTAAATADIFIYGFVIE